MIDCGNQIDTETHNKVLNIFSLLLNKPIQGVINIHPAYNSLMLSLDYDVDILDVVKKIKILISDNTFKEKELKMQEKEEVKEEEKKEDEEKVETANENN